MISLSGIYEFKFLFWVFVLLFEALFHFSIVFVKDNRKSLGIFALNLNLLNDFLLSFEKKVSKIEITEK